MISSLSLAFQERQRQACLTNPKPANSVLIIKAQAPIVPNRTLKKPHTRDIIEAPERPAAHDRAGTQRKQMGTAGYSYKLGTKV